MFPIKLSCLLFSVIILKLPYLPILSQYVCYASSAILTLTTDFSRSVSLHTVSLSHNYPVLSHIIRHIASESSVNYCVS
jgi:hypothetical protein